jgi:hypothetical protein
MRHGGFMKEDLLENNCQKRKLLNRIFVFSMQKQRDLSIDRQKNIDLFRLVSLPNFLVGQMLAGCLAELKEAADRDGGKINPHTWPQSRSNTCRPTTRTHQRPREKSQFNFHFQVWFLRLFTS